MMLGDCATPLDAVKFYLANDRQADVRNVTARDCADGRRRPWWDHGSVGFAPLDYTDRNTLWKYRRWVQQHTIKPRLNVHFPGAFPRPNSATKLILL